MFEVHQEIGPRQAVADTVSGNEGDRGQPGDETPAAPIDARRPLRHSEPEVLSILDEHHLAGEVKAVTGDLRRSRVDVTLAQTNDEEVARLQETLGAYLFEATCRRST